MCNGPPGAYRHLFDLDEIGRIPSKDGYPPRAKVAKLPFLPMVLVRSAMCLADEAHGAERASYMQNQVLLPALVARLDVEVIEKKKKMAGHEAKATDTASDANARQRANASIVPQTPYIAALGKVRLSIGESF